VREDEWVVELSRVAMAIERATQILERNDSPSARIRTTFARLRRVGESYSTVQGGLPGDMDSSRGANVFHAVRDPQDPTESAGALLSA